MPVPGHRCGRYRFADLDVRPDSRDTWNGANEGNESLCFLDRCDPAREMRDASRHIHFDAAYAELRIIDQGGPDTNGGLSVFDEPRANLNASEIGFVSRLSD